MTRSLISPGRQRERDLVELRHHLALREEAQVAALDLAAVVLGELRRELGEVRAAFDLGEQILRLFLHRRVVFAFGLEEDVAGATCSGVVYCCLLSS